MELRSCPGLANHNRQFVEGFLKRASLLTELLKEDIQWGGNPECQVAFDGLKQAMIEGPILGVANATKPFKVEIERFNRMLGEYLGHFVDRRQRNWAQLPNVVQFGHNAQTDSSTRRRNNPQVHKFAKEWEQMADIARTCLEKASRQIEKKVDQK
ncbi:putative mitochondrial protein [Cucumis melo var. makuwa]|uniref:Mitochondrial protein n=1 Tax=Cucumis melo var. makuwa TaxID=1194695 RepID=A0A5D3CUU9_CUCMM|nr:putative mitochondrial protein [Cucumis melo var. makuwa]TYK15265.1 putative mitochondrial protein [Cucumis melo var. makuwa]